MLNDKNNNTEESPTAVPRPRNAWLELLRPPNLFTVPGDPLAGYFVAMAALGATVRVQAWRLVAVAAASLLLYAGGLLQNDFFDLDEDRLQRPRRPLPSGRANPTTVITVAFVLALAGVAVAWAAGSLAGAAAGATLVVMTFYNAGGKRLSGAGPILMGACRGLSFLIGAGLLGRAGQRAPAVEISTLGLTALVAVVTLIASRETQSVRVGLRRFLPGLVTAVFLGAVLAMLPHAAPRTWIGAAAVGAWATFWMFFCGGFLKGTPPPPVVQATIGLFIVGLMFVQAALAMHVQPLGWFVASALMLAWVLARRVGQWFYAS